MAPLRIKDHRRFDPLRGNRALDPFFAVGKHLSRSYRWATAAKRVLPGFLVIGAAKSGTTSLFHYLSQHPQIFPGLHKEVHYFDHNPHRSVAWYRSHFPLRARLAGRGLTGEASPSYLSHPLAAERIRHTLPDARLIAILRNPVERAISQYFHVKKWDPGPGMSLSEILAWEDADRLRDMRSGQASPEVYYRSLKYRGLYAEQVRRYLRYFPRESLHVVIFEKMCRDPAGELRKAFSFLGVDDAFVPGDLRPKNTGLARHGVSPLVVGELERFFAPHNSDLSELLGVDLPW